MGGAEPVERGQVMTELLPCPFCGGEAVAYREPSNGNGQRLWRVECENIACSAAISDANTKAAAVTAWNRRDTKSILLAFYHRVCDRAEANMAATGTVSGAHWNAMRQELKALGIEVTR